MKTFFKNFSFVVLITEQTVPAALFLLDSNSWRLIPVLKP